MSLEELYAAFDSLKIVGPPGWRTASSQGVFSYTIRRGQIFHSLTIPHPRTMSPEARAAIVEDALEKYGRPERRPTPAAGSPPLMAR